MPPNGNPAFDAMSAPPPPNPSSPPWSPDQQMRPDNARRPGTGGANPTHRFTVVNLADHEQSPISPVNYGPTSTGTKPFVSAHEEKRQIQDAMSRVDRYGTLQQSGASYSDPPDQTAQSSSSMAPLPAAGSSSQTAPKKWLSAEEEKAQMLEQRQRFDAARERALQLQAAGRMQADQNTGSDHISVSKYSSN